MDQPNEGSVEVSGLVEANVDEAREDQLWQARTGLTLETLGGAIETIIFMGDHPISIKKIKSLIDEELPLRVIHTALQGLQANYEQKHHGIRLMEVAEGFHFRTKATYAKYVQDLFKVNTLILSPSSLEVLAIIAYKQPVAKTEIDKIRGVDSAHLVRALVEKRLVKVSGRSDDAGRPSLLSTTTEFLEVFNLASLNELPPEQELEEMALQTNRAQISEIREIVQATDKHRFYFNEMDELEQLAESIRSIAADTPFTKELKHEQQKKVDSNKDPQHSGMAVTTPTHRSAFEILEEFILRKEIGQQMQQAAASSLMIPAIAPQVIRDLAAGPFNLPAPEDEDDFAMIDLDSGEVIATPSRNLAQDLQEAFTELLATKFSSPVLSSEQETTALEEKETMLDQTTLLLQAQAKDLDLDLDFTRENSGADEFNS